ncbi:Putative bap28 [Trichuris trichiura]|uniref:Putative bap28 n=1 Tax=Trichuris trichiura TaxID=36087 RepID=A0A077ZLM4_TRITR|nr:Putative bap28 [Trichuris trichiura]
MLRSVFGAVADCRSEELRLPGVAFSPAGRERARGLSAPRRLLWMKCLVTLANHVGTTWLPELAICLLVVSLEKACI